MEYALQAAPEYDTFGSTAAEVARRAAETDAAGRAGAALPSLMPDELLAPVADSMGETARHDLTCGGLVSHISLGHPPMSLLFVRMVCHICSTSLSTEQMQAVR